MRTREGIARDFFAAFDAFQEKRVARALRDAQVGAYRSQQVRGKYIVNGDEVSLFREALEFAEVRLNHGCTSLRSNMETPKQKAFVEKNELPAFTESKEEILRTPSQGGKDSTAHGGFRSALPSPDFPLRETLCQKHVYPGQRGNPLLRRNLQELGPLGAVNEIHDDATL